jgi:hypothetical protein
MIDEHYAARQILNPKHEILNNFEIQNPKQTRSFDVRLDFPRIERRLLAF